jgi:phosphoglycolate phosphatase
MTALSAIRAVVFDLDGTLVDSLDDIFDHLNGALVDHGFAARERDEVREWVGHGAENLIRRAVSDEALVAPVLARFRDRYRAAPVVKTAVYPGLDRVLDELAPGRAFAVLSNKPHDLTRAICGMLLTRWSFPVVEGQRAGRPHKPDPAALTAIADQLGVDRGACVLIGDSEVDVATAKAAGIAHVAVTWGLRARQVLVDAAPDHLIDTPEALRALFG